MAGRYRIPAGAPVAPEVWSVFNVGDLKVSFSLFLLSLHIDIYLFIYIDKNRFHIRPDVGRMEDGVVIPCHHFWINRDVSNSSQRNRADYRRSLIAV